MLWFLLAPIRFHHLSSNVAPVLFLFFMANVFDWSQKHAFTMETRAPWSKHGNVIYCMWGRWSPLSMRIQTSWICQGLWKWIHEHASIWIIYPSSNLFTCGGKRNSGSVGNFFLMWCPQLKSWLITHQSMIVFTITLVSQLSTNLAIYGGAPPCSNRSRF